MTRTVLDRWADTRAHLRDLIYAQRWPVVRAQLRVQRGRAW